MTSAPPPPPLLTVPAPKPPKLHLPPFDGSAPLDWMFQVDQYFSYHQVPPPQRLAVISFYMQCEALSWFKWLYTNQQLSSWDAFLRALELCFGSSSFDNHQTALFKLRQCGSVSDFQADFERLCNRVVSLSPEPVLNYFISGLRSDIQREMAVFQPTSISQSIGLAKLIEAKTLDARSLSVVPPPPAPRPPALLPTRQFSLGPFHSV
ncbi:UNVERIFIED_CONTAM: hypothetical protein Slati_1910300 [Sesamum latifolium]|uniref:Retrotransposon gag domain-containing protein n=1 Tax=Sesamum latifolium TaxID=2727402 RepID=A0AAW2X3F2_9LAMI